MKSYLLFWPQCHCPGRNIVHHFNVLANQPEATTLFFHKPFMAIESFHWTLRRRPSGIGRKHTPRKPTSLLLFSQMLFSTLYISIHPVRFRSDERQKWKKKGTESFIRFPTTTNIVLRDYGGCITFRTSAQFTAAVRPRGTFASFNNHVNAFAKPKISLQFPSR